MLGHVESAIKTSNAGAEIKDERITRMALEGIQLHLVNSMDDASRCIEWLGRVKDDVIGFDTEGTGIDTQVDKVRMIQFGCENEGWSIPYDRWSGLAVDIINRWDKRFVGLSFGPRPLRLLTLRWQLRRTRLHLPVLLARC